MKQVYIPSVEASDIYSHVVRGSELELNFRGMIPYSLELIKLHKCNSFNVEKVKEDKDYGESEDLINLRFKQSVISGKKFIPKLISKIERVKSNLDELKKKQVSDKEKEKHGKKVESTNLYVNKLEQYLELVKEEVAGEEAVKKEAKENGVKNEEKLKWDGLSKKELRKYLYQNGFTVMKIDEETGEILSKVKYVVYKRSSAKSRKGEVLFIKEALYKDMIKWSRMGLSFEEGMEVDYASLLAYESLVGSTIESVLKINPKNMLIVDDVESKFQVESSIVQKSDKLVEEGEKRYLDSVRSNEGVVKNSLFDGESLLDSKYFEEGKGMKLLRNHMFKSCAFNCNVQEFLKDNCPEGKKYENWKITDMFGNQIAAKNVEFIFTPSSLKALKFSDLIGGQSEMYDHWRGLVKAEGSMFGVCKSEKESRRGKNDKDETLQQLSYQMLNCLPANKEDINVLAGFEIEYINKLKNNIDFFISHVEKESNEMNTNMMFVDLYHHNNNMRHTKLFRDFKKTEINRYVTNVRKGKVRLVGDYAVLLGNPLEFLYHAIGKLDMDKSSLVKNEIHTTMFDEGKKLVGFRNPNTAPSNVFIGKNIRVEEISKYFNLTKNIVCVSAINFQLQDILSGCDYDSDTILLLDNEKMLELAEKCFGKYPVCINNVESRKKPYFLNKENMAEIDDALSISQRQIGQVVNAGQLLMSTYWDAYHKGKSEAYLNKIMKKIEIINVLSGISIDMAKKFYDLKIDDEIKHINSEIGFKTEKPKFWRYVKKKDKNKKEQKKLVTTYYNCPMDYLYGMMDEFKNAEGVSDIPLKDFITKRTGKPKDEQMKKIIDRVNKMCDKINGAYLRSEDEDEIEKVVSREIRNQKFYIEKLKVNEDTMYSLLNRVAKMKVKNSTRLMNMLYETQTETFKNGFKSGKKGEK